MLRSVVLNGVYIFGGNGDKNLTLANGNVSERKAGLLLAGMIFKVRVGRDGFIAR